MNKANIQIRGNCPCCGNDQAVVNGSMSNHGYTVADGWFRGVCSGRDYAPVQICRKQTDRIVESIRDSVAALRVELEAVASGKVTPKTVVKGYGKNQTEIKFSDAALYDQAQAVESLKRSIAHRINTGEDFAKHLETVANKYHGQPLREVNLDAPVGIVVGSSVKVQGSVVTVTKIEYRAARGVGPSINGQTILHVCFERNGKEFAYPKRFAKLV
jgi:hypothetical protein